MHFLGRHLQLKKKEKEKKKSGEEPFSKKASGQNLNQTPNIYTS